MNYLQILGLALCAIGCIGCYYNVINKKPFDLKSAHIYSTIPGLAGFIMLMIDTINHLINS